MNKKKLTALTVMALMTISIQPFTVSAASMEPPSTKVEVENRVIALRWANTTMVIPPISNSGKDISVSVLITPEKKTEKTVGTLYLQKYSGGKWKTEASWSIDDSGTVDITKTFTGEKKVKYRTKVVITTGSDDITATSSEITLR